MNISQFETALDEMSFADLKSAAPMVTEKIAQREKVERDAVKAELAELAKSKGFAMAELFGDAPKSAKEKKKVPPKYRNPADSSQTWTGRGRKPKWVVEALDLGGSLDDLLIRD